MAMLTPLSSHSEYGPPATGLHKWVRALKSVMGMDTMGGFNQCLANCSGHGECWNGVCLCEVQYDGAECGAPNMGYHAGFAVVFLLVALTCLIQLIMCVHAEYLRQKTPSLAKACSITTQKLMYFLVFLAALLRGIYFAYPATSEGWSASLSSAYYPVLLTVSSLVVCFWAEVFHLREDGRSERQFLSKSMLGFIIFNVLTYSLLAAEMLLTTSVNSTDEERVFYTSVFNGCYAVLLFVVVIFFLIYGVEVYFKVRGGFLGDCDASPASPVHRNHNRKPVTGSPSDILAEGEGLMSDTQIRGGFQSGISLSVDMGQLHQSRFGLVFQAVMLIGMCAFLFSDIFGDYWKKMVPLESRNTHDVVFRVVELSVALWFPCVLWNCIRPDQLWILNPKKILKKFDLEQELESKDKATAGGAYAAPYASEFPKEAEIEKGECFICYDSDRTDAGALIQPCACKGDVSVVHHECLRRWIIESALNPDALKCKVCQESYCVEKGVSISWGHALTLRHWLQTGFIIAGMVSAAGAAWAVIQIYQDSGIRLLAVGVALLIEYVCLRFLGVNTVMAYQRAKVSAIHILGRRYSTPPEAGSSGAATSVDAVQEVASNHRTLPVATISHTVALQLDKLPHTDLHAPVRA